MFSWHQGLRVWQKLLLIGVTYTLPIVVLLYLYVGETNKAINFAEWEKKGNAYQRPLEELLNYLPRHKMAAQRSLNGDASAKAELTALVSQIENAFVKLEAVDKKYGADLEFTEEGLNKRKREVLLAGALRKKWQGLKSQLSSLKPDASNDQHTQLIADVKAMIGYSGDTSNLILDPDLDSYYIMDVTLLALPQTQDRLAVVMDFGEGLLNRKAMTGSERIKLEVYAAMLEESDLGRVQADFKTALNEDPNFYGTSDSFQFNVPPVVAEYAAANEVFIALTRQIAASEKVELDPKAYLDAGTAARAASFKLWDIADRELDVLLQTRIDIFKYDRMVSLLATAIAVLLASLLVYLITRSITNPLNDAVRKLFTSGNQVASGAAQVAASSQRMSEGATEQASSLEETSSSLEEIASMTRQNADNAKQASSLAGKARESVEAGNVVIAHMDKAMIEIKSASDDVGKIIRTIDEIAFQTNLLALNAAVEAARAGDAGRGFAVVADEVRNLAQRSATAAKESAAMIEAAVVKANIGVATSLKVAETFKEINSNIIKANDLVSEIAAASQEQSQGIQQVTTAVQQMDQIVQSNASNSDQFAATAEEMAAQAGYLKDVVDEMTKMVGRSALGVEEHPAAAAARTNAPSVRQTSASHQDRNITPITGRMLARKSAEDKIPLAGDETGKGEFKRF